MKLKLALVAALFAVVGLMGYLAYNRHSAQAYSTSDSPGLSAASKKELIAAAIKLNNTKSQYDKANSDWSDLVTKKQLEGGFPKGTNFNVNPGAGACNPTSDGGIKCLLDVTVQLPPAPQAVQNPAPPVPTPKK